MQILTPLFLGMLFGLGLILSGMTNPGKVQAFLDFAGKWDPSLGLVMAGAIGVAILPFQLQGRLKSSWFGTAFPSAGKTDVDRAVILGSAIFGIGWGLVGYCPGPALVALGRGDLSAFVFVTLMVFGIEAYDWIEAAKCRRDEGRAG